MEKTPVETRCLKKAQLHINEERAADGKALLTGVIKYNTRSDPEAVYDEQLQRTAFNKTLSDGADILQNVQHSDSVKNIVGSTKSGTLRLNNQPDGLHFELDMINTTASKDAFTLIQLGILNGVSFEFEDIKSDWGVDQKTHRQTRVIREAKLRAISIGVLRPYYKENVSQVIKGGKDDRTDDGVNEAAEARQLEQKQLVNNTEKQLDFNSLLLSAVIK